MPTHKNHVYFAPHTETEYFEIPTQKPTQFRSLHWSPVDFDLHYKIKSIWTPRHQNQVNFDAYTKPRSTSTPTPKPSSFWSLHWNEVNFDSHSYFKSILIPRRKNRVNLDTDTKNKSFSTAAHNQVNSDPPHWNQVYCDHHTHQLNQFHLYTEIKPISIPHNEINSISTHTKTKSISLLTLKPSDLRHAYKNEPISTTHTKNQVNRSLH